jgi:hypothetical protein
MANLMPGESGGLPVEYYPQMQDISRQLKMADLLRQQQAPQGQMVSGHYVAPSITQHLARALSEYTANKKEKEAYGKQDEIYRGYQEKQTTAAQKLAEMLRPQADPMQSEMPTENPDGSTSYGATPTKPVSPNDTLDAISQYYAMGGNDPRMANMALERARFGQQDQVREDTQQFNQQQLQVQQEAAAQARQEARKSRMQELQIKLMDAQASREERAQAQRELAQMQIDARKDMAILAASLRPAPVAPSVTPATIVRNGKQVIVDARTGREIGEAPPSAKTADPTTQKVSDAQDVLAILDQAEPLIKGATGSGLGAMVDSAQGFFGGTNKGAQNTAKLQALEGLLVSKMPKMSGPQSDKDVLLYKQMAGKIGDPWVPYEEKKAAMDTIREVNRRYASQPQATAAPRKNVTVDF